MYKNIIFDLYGTLIDIKTDEESSSFWHSITDFYKKNKANYKQDELKSTYLFLCNKYKKKISKIKKTDYVDIELYFVFKKLYLLKNINPTPKLVKETMNYFREKSTKYIKLYDHVKELLTLLIDKKCNLYVLSDAQRYFTIPEIKKLGIDKYFKDIYISSIYRISKPNKDYFEILIDKHNLNKEETIYIGNDYNKDIIGARNANVKSIYVKSNLSPKDDYIYEKEIAKCVSSSNLLDIINFL